MLAEPRACRGSCTRALLQHNKPCPFCSVDIAYTDLGKQPGKWQAA